MQRFIGSTLALTKIECRMCLAEASFSLSVRAEKRHIESNTVRMSINPG